MIECVLENPVEGDGLPGVDGLVAGYPLEILVEEPLQLSLEQIDPRAGVAQHVDPLFVVTEGEEQVLDGHVGVPTGHRFADRGLHGHLEFSAEAAHLVPLAPSDYFL